MAKGTVFLVGAGPGDPGLITVRGAKCLGSADVIVYDRLINERLLDLAPTEAERIFVGKSSVTHTLEQDEIARVLINKALEGKTVVRLKGGDPFIFGRGGEEALALTDAGIGFEVVPGVTAGVAVPAYAGIPATHRGISTSVVLVTGHEDPTKECSDVDWTKVAGIGSVVVYMGVKNLPIITEALIDAGRAPETPCAVIHNGTTPRQETVEGNLGSIVDAVKKRGIEPPAILLVGDVVKLRAKLNWFERRPLFGKRVIVTRTRQQASRQTALLEEAGAAVVEIPLIEIGDSEGENRLRDAVASLDLYDWVVFTSANGVDAVFGILEKVEEDARAFGKAKIAAIGPATADRLRERGISADFVPERYLSGEIADALIAKGWVEGRTFLLPRADIAGRELPKRLREAGAQVDEVVAYRTVPANASREQLLGVLRERQADIITFASSSCVTSFVELLSGEDIEKLIEGVCVATIGPVTSATAKEHGLPVTVEATEHTIVGMVEELKRCTTL